MSKVGESIIEGMEDALAYARGDTSRGKTHIVHVLDYGQHEALDRSWLAVNMVGRDLLEHPAIKDNPSWERLATIAHDALFELYQRIGDDGS